MKPVLLAIPMAFALVVAASARDDEHAALTFLINSGAVVHIADNGTDVSEPQLLTLEPPTPWLRAVVRHLTGGKYDWATGDKFAMIGQKDVDLPADPVPPGEIRIAFRAVGDSDQRVLNISNGYDRALAFRAHIHVKGEDRYTDVCTVLPGKHGIEHWPYAIDWITLSDLRLEEWPEGKAARCE